jgi:hypothetical protein
MIERTDPCRDCGGDETECPCDPTTAEGQA